MLTAQTSKLNVAYKKSCTFGNALLGGVVLCVSLWAIAIGIGYHSYHNERQKVERELIHLGDQLSHNMLIILKNTDHALRQSTAQFAQHWERLKEDPIQAHAILANSFASLFYLEDAHLIDKNGRHLLSYFKDFSTQSSTHVILFDQQTNENLTTDAHNLVIRADPNSPLLIASYPVFNEDGEVVAHALARIKTDIVQSFYKIKNDPHPHYFSISNETGILIEAPGVSDQVSKNRVDHTIFTAAFGLKIHTQIPLEEALADWRNHTYAYALIGLVLSAVIVLYSYRTHCTLQRLHDENEKRRETEKDLQKLSQVVEQSPVSVVITDKDATIEYVNPKFSQATGYSLEEALGQNPKFLHGDEESFTNYDTMWKTLLSGQEWRGEFFNKRKDGSTFWEHASLSPIKDKNGNITHYVAVKEDITDRKETEDRLGLAAAVFETASEGIMVCNSEREIETVNTSFCEITGYSKEEIIGQKPSILKSGYHDKEFYQNMSESLERMGFWEGEIWNKRKNGDIYPQHLSIKALKDDHGCVIHYISLLSDITIRKQNEERILYQANYDALTNLPNRSLFQDRLKQAVMAAERNQTKVALLFIDLDRFKHVNDTLGHASGDLLLKEAANRLTGLIRKSDTVARLGGDEFTVIIQDLSDFHSIESLVDKMLVSLSAPYDLENNTAYVSASIGITIYPNDATNIDDLLRNADAAMYQAKEGGRNLSHFFTKKMNDQARERRRLETALHAALEREEFVLHYQPIVDIQTGRLTSCESLLRWHQPEHGNVYPDKFIPLAEDTGLILPIGQWVLEKACIEAKIWERYCDTPPNISVNMSSKQFQRANMVTLVKETLKRTGLAPVRLTLEITESLLIADDSLIIDQLYGLRDLGVGLSIDDFGTGYSSLGYLRQFPITTLKIDRAFIKDLPDDEEASALVSAILSMADSLKLKVVAEGVETKAQLDKLRAEQCDFVQGYYYSPPLPIEAFREIVKKEGPINPDE